MNPLNPLVVMGTGTLFTIVGPLVLGSFVPGLGVAHAAPDPTHPGGSVSMGLASLPVPTVTPFHPDSVDTSARLDSSHAFQQALQQLGLPHSLQPLDPTALAGTLTASQPPASPRASTPDQAFIPTPVPISTPASTPDPASTPTLPVSPGREDTPGLANTPTLATPSEPADPPELANTLDQAESPDLPESSPRAESEAPAERVTQTGPLAAPTDSMPAGVDLNAPHLRSLLVDSNPLSLPLDPSQVVLSETLALTLAEVVAVALHNNPALQTQAVALLQQQEALKQQQAQRLPSLSFNSNIQHTGTDTDVLDTNATLPSAASDSTRDITTFNGSVRLDYDLYDPDRRPSIRAAEQQVRQSELLLEQAREQLRLDATSDYYQLQNSDEQVRIADGAVAAAQRSLEDAIQLERAGVGTKFAVLQAEVQLANEQQNLVNAQANRRKAQRQLAQRLNLPPDTNLVAADTVTPAGQWPLALGDSIIRAFENRPELEQSRVAREISDAQRQVALAATRPTLGLFSQYTLDTNLSETSSNGTDTHQDTFSRQYAIGINLNWRFFDGGAARASARQQELGRETAELEFADNRNQIRQQVENAYYDLEANQQNIATANLGVGQARDALCLARLRFQAGVGTQIDVINAERDLTRAEGNLATAIVNYNLALAQMQRATSDFAQELPASPSLPAYESTITTQNCR